MHVYWCIPICHIPSPIRDRKRAKPLIYDYLQITQNEKNWTNKTRRRRRRGKTANKNKSSLSSPGDKRHTPKNKINRFDRIFVVPLLLPFALCGVWVRSDEFFCDLVIICVNLNQRNGASPLPPQPSNSERKKKTALWIFIGDNGTNTNRYTQRRLIGNGLWIDNFQ